MTQVKVVINERNLIEVQGRHTVECRKYGSYWEIGRWYFRNRKTGEEPCGTFKYKRDALEYAKHIANEVFYWEDDPDEVT